MKRPIFDEIIGLTSKTDSIHTCSAKLYGQDDVNPDDAKTSHLINDRLSLNLPLREEILADLRFIVDAWAELSEAIQQAMLAMVQATVKRGDGE